MIYQPFGTFFGCFSSKTIRFLVVDRKIVSYFEKFNGLMFLMIEAFDGSFLIRAFLIERECVYAICNTQFTVSVPRKIAFRAT